MVGTRFMVQWEEHPSHLSTRLGRLLEAQAFVDVTLMCATHSLRVHGSVLAACSPYFEELLKLQVGHHPLIMLKDMKFCVLRALIEFMYCGETSITEADLRPLLDAAKFFKVKGLSSMTAEVLSDLPQSKISQASSSDEGKNVTCSKTPQTTPSASTLSTTSGASFIRSSQKTSIVKPRKSIAPPKIDSVAVEMNDTSGLPQDESAKILLSLSAGSNKVVQKSSRGRGSNNRLLTQGPGRPPNRPIVINNCSFGSSDTRMETRSKLVSTFEPRRRGRKKQIPSVSSSNNNSSQLSMTSTLKSYDCSNSSIIDNFKMLHRDARYSKLLSFSNDPKLNSITANMEKSPLLASLLSKEDAPSNKKVSGSKSGAIDIKSPSASGSAGYIEALKAAGLPTDVPIIVDTGDGNYVTLTEDVFMDVLSSSDSLQFQVTEETLDDSVSITEGVVMQDGSIVTEEGRELVAEPHSSKKLFADHIKQYSKSESQEMYSTIGSGKSIISDDKSDITETVIETLKSSTSDDSDAVVLVEVKGNQVVRYVVSSKEIDALKALNEEKKWQKSGFDSVRPISNSSNNKNSTKIAEINLTLNDSEAPKKSYITEFIETGSGLTSVAKAICERLPVKVYKENLYSRECNSSSVDSALIDDTRIDTSKFSTNHAYEALAMMCNESEPKEERRKLRQSNIESIELMQNSEMEISNIGPTESHLINSNGVEYIYVSEESQLHGIDPSMDQSHSLMNGATRNVVLVKNKNGAPDTMSVEQALEAMMGNRIVEMENFNALQPPKDSKSDSDPLKQCLGEDEPSFHYVLDSNSVDKEMLDDCNSNQSYSNMVLYSNKDAAIVDTGGVSKYQMVDDQFSERMRDSKMLSNILINSAPEMEDELIMNEDNDVKSLGMINQVLNTTDQLNENDVTESSGYHSASIEFQEENENSGFGDENGVEGKEDSSKFLSKETVFSESNENDNYQIVESSEKSGGFCSVPKNSSDVPFAPSKLKSNLLSNVSDRVLRKRRSSSGCDSRRNSIKQNCVTGEKRSKLLNDNHNDSAVIIGNGDENILEEVQFMENGQTDTMISSQLIDSNNLS